MKCSVVGYEFFDYRNKAGQIVPSCRLHVEYMKRECQGIAVEPIFVRRDALGSYSPKIGDEIIVDFNRYHGVDSIDYA